MNSRSGAVGRNEFEAVTLPLNPNPRPHRPVPPTAHHRGSAFLMPEYHRPDPLHQTSTLERLLTRFDALLGID